MHTTNTEMAQQLLREVRFQFDIALTALAHTCAPKGKLDPAVLDAHQHASYEVAWINADLLAAETLMADGATERSEIDWQLAHIFVVEAITSSLPRLEALFLDLQLPITDLQKVAVHADWSALRQSASGADALTVAGRGMVAVEGDVAKIPMGEELGMVQDSFRRFASEVVAPQAEKIHRHDLTVPEALLAPMREMGVFGLSIPESLGGTGPDDREDTTMMVVVTEALSEASLAAAGSLITRPEILSRALITGGTDAQKARWLPQIAAGEPLCAIAITEPDFGSNVADLALRGTPAPGGWLLNGAKTWCTFAGKAGLLMVVTRTHPDRTLGHKGLSLLLVEKPSYDGHAFDFRQPGGGRLSGKAIPTIGYRGMHSFDLSFEDFFVPEENVIGEEKGLGQGFYFTMAGMTGGRMQTSARALGVMRAAIAAALQYGAVRKVFGSPLADYQLTLTKYARMGARFLACRLLTYRVAQMLDSGAGRMEASLVKLLSCRSAELITRESLQIHGGMGYAEESPISRYFVDARVLSIFEGAEETLALKVIARSLMQDALDADALQKAA